MALSGSYTFNGTYGVNLVFSWTATQNTTNNSSTVSWKLYLTGSSSNGNGMFGFGTFKINGSTVYELIRGNIPDDEATRLANLPLDTGIIANGTVTISHSTTGAGSFTFEGTGYSPYYIVFGASPIQLDQGITGSQTFTLNTINRTSKVAATAANIGENTKITITRYVSSYTHTLTYKFGSLTGTIATKTSNTTVNWTVPTTFYAQIPNATYGTCTITCQTYNGSTLVGSSTATFRASIKGDSCAPTLSPAVVDVNSDTIALTGNANKLIRFESMVEFQSGATARNSATLKTQSVVNGSVTKTDFAIGTIDDVESPDFIFSATDSRGLTTTQTYTAEMVMYVKPTCYQKIRAELEGETGARIYIEVSGNYFNGSFGAVSNTLKYEIKATNPDGTQTDWTELPVNVTYGDDNTYTIDFELTGYGYSSSYEFQSRITDKLNVVQSTVYVVRVLPIFDWDKDDFNFNVPVNISADTLDIHNETVLRHGKTTNNTVLSGSGGHIYLRPGGTNNTSGEVRITAQGNIEITGDIIINGVSLVTALENKGIL